MSSTDTVSITRDEFDTFVEDLPRKFEEKEWNWTQEAVYECELPRDDHIIVFRIWSSVDVRDEHSRKKGEDAIRVHCLVKQDHVSPANWKHVLHHSQLPDDCGGHIKRTDGWQDRVCRHLACMESALGAEKYRTCLWCDRPMVIRKRQLDDTKFWGCSGFPDCRHMEEFDP
jgi:CRISPR/Cas system-associated endoribonuclease Cas2